MFYKNERGFTLTELIIVMAIFMTVIMITATAFKTIITNSSQQSKSVETQIEGIVGLEVLRADLEQAGFGLPWVFPSGFTYTEATDGSVPLPTVWPTGNSPATFNDAPGSAPRAILSGTTTFNMDTTTTPNIGSTYLVIKSTVAAASDASKKWTTVSYGSDGTKTVAQWGSTDRDFSPSERVIVVKNSLITTPPTRQLMVSSGSAFSATFGTYTSMITSHQNGDTFQIYGVSPQPATPALLKIPFNRADYYITRPSTIPKSCAAKTGILYKALVLQTSSGGLAAGMPLLDCVADMQVVYGLDTSGAGFVNFHTTTPLTTADDVRNQVREVRVYILAQEGIKDTGFNYPSTTVDVGESFDGGASFKGRRFNLLSLIGADYKYYRWKVYTIVVRPKNLIQ